MQFKYLKEPAGEDLFQASYAYKYLDYMYLNLGWASSRGFSPIKRRIYKLWRGFVVAYTYFVLMLIVMSLLWTFDLSHADTLFTSLEVFSHAPAYTIKSTLMLLNRWRIDKAKDLLDVMSQRCSSYKERLEVHQLVNRCNYIMCVGQAIFFVPVTLNFFAAISSGNPVLNLYNPFVDWHESTQSLWIASFMEYLMALFCIYAVVAQDAMPLIFGLTLRAHIKWLRQRVDKLRHNPDKSEEENYKELVLCIKDHKLILDYFKIIRPLISNSMLVQYATISLVLASNLIHLVMFANRISGITTVVYMLATLLQTFPFSYICDLIVEDCGNLSLAIFHSNWIGSTRPYRSALIYFIHKVQQPIVFLGGGVFPISLNLNIKVAKFAFSLMTLVQQMSFFENY